jgi:hypothetical protein
LRRREITLRHAGKHNEDNATENNLLLIIKKIYRMPKDFMPTKKNDFFDWVNNVLMSYVSAHYAEWNITSIDALVALFDAFNARYLTAENPTTRTPAAVKAFQNARSEFENELRKFIKSHITYNPLVTDEDRVNMHLPIHDSKPTPVQPPNSYPDFEVDSSIIRRLTLNFRDSGSTSKAKPRGVHGAEIRWSILDTPPELVDDIAGSAFTTRTPYTMEFTEVQRGKSVYFCMRWETGSGQKGPWSEIVKAIIP